MRDVANHWQFWHAKHRGSFAFGGPRDSLPAQIALHRHGHPSLHASLWLVLVTVASKTLEVSPLPAAIHQQPEDETITLQP
jgi:hypothetical protein